MNPSKVILLILLASNYSCNEKVSQVQSLPDDEYYQKIEKDYSDFKNRFGDRFENTLPDIPKETRNPIKVPAKLIKCFETNMPDLPGIPGTLTRPVFDTGQHTIDAIYQTKITDQIHSDTQINITIYQNYEQARKFSVFYFTTVAEPQAWKPDIKQKMADYSWSTEQKGNSLAFKTKILFSNLHIIIMYSEGSLNPDYLKRKQVNYYERKQEVYHAILKMIEECQ
jgi:hypothetical protein